MPYCQIIEMLVHQESQEPWQVLKVRAKRKFGDGTGIKITPEIERLFRLIVESELLNDKKINITSAHRQFEELFVQHYPHIKQGDIPTRRQFDHFYKREYELPQRIEARTPVLSFQKMYVH